LFFKHKISHIGAIHPSQSLG